MQYVPRNRKSENTEKKMIEYTNTEIAKQIADHIHSQRDRDILSRRLIDGVRYEKLAEEFELSVRQVKNIVYKSEQKLFR